MLSAGAAGVAERAVSASLGGPETGLDARHTVAATQIASPMVRPAKVGVL